MAGLSVSTAHPATRARTALLVAVGITVGLYLLPFGRFLAAPLLYFSTFAHEMGHGLTAELVGADFVFFKMWPGGSGVARHAGDPGRIARALISAGGLVGPAVLAAGFFILARREKLARASLLGLGGFCLLALLLWVRNPFGWLFVGALAALCLALARRGSPFAAQVTLVFLAIQLSLSVFSRGDYLFTERARTGAGDMPSDVAHIADALLLPYWFWGAAIGLFSVAVLVFGLRSFLRSATADWA